MGPVTQVAVGSSVGEAAGSVGSVEGRLIVCHAHPAGSAPVPASSGSVTLNVANVTSPTFSAVNL